MSRNNPKSEEIDSNRRTTIKMGAGLSASLVTPALFGGSAAAAPSSESDTEDSELSVDRELVQEGHRYDVMKITVDQEPTYIKIDKVNNELSGFEHDSVGNLASGAEVGSSSTGSLASAQSFNWRKYLADWDYGTEGFGDDCDADSSYGEHLWKYLTFEVAPEVDELSKKAFVAIIVGIGTYLGLDADLLEQAAELLTTVSGILSVNQFTMGLKDGDQSLVITTQKYASVRYSRKYDQDMLDCTPVGIIPGAHVD